MTKLTKPVLGALFGLAVLAALAMQTAAPKEKLSTETSKGPIIDGAMIHFDEDRIKILGLNLHDGTDPVVTLGGFDIEGPHELDQDGEAVKVELPDILDGTYVLTLETKRGFDSIDLTIGAVGPPTTVIAGPGLILDSSNGDVTLGVDFPSLVTEGGITIESLDDSVRIVSRTSEIVIDPSGGIEIRGNQTIRIQSTHELKLFAPGIDINAAGISIVAERIAIEATEDLILNGRNVIIGAQQATPISSGADTNITAAGALALEGDAADIAATGGPLKLSGVTMDIDAMGGPLKLSGGTTDIDATGGPLNLTGNVVDINAGGPLTLKGSVINLN